MSEAELIEAKAAPKEIEVNWSGLATAIDEAEELCCPSANKLSLAVRNAVGVERDAERGASEVHDDFMVRSPCRCLLRGCIQCSRADYGSSRSYACAIARKSCNQFLK